MFSLACDTVFPNQCGFIFGGKCIGCTENTICRTQSPEAFHLNCKTEEYCIDSLSNRTCAEKGDLQSIFLSILRSHQICEFKGTK